ncbi:MAG: S4 domain-containing protein [Chloroflexaceae bacterium]
MPRPRRPKPPSSGSSCSAKRLPTSPNIRCSPRPRLLAASKSEARRLIDGGGVRVNGERVEGYDLVLQPGANAVVQVGRRKFVRVV